MSIFALYLKIISEAVKYLKTKQKLSIISS